MRVSCEVDYVDLDGDYTEIPSVRVTCSRCGHEVESYGQHERSVRRCLVLLRQQCPRGEKNFYVTDEDDE